MNSSCVTANPRGRFVVWDLPPLGKDSSLGTVEPYSSAAGRRYRVRYRKPDHSQTTKRGFTTKKEAELYLASIELGKAAGTFIDPSKARITVGTLGAQWLKARTHLKPAASASEQASSTRRYRTPIARGRRRPCASTSARECAGFVRGGRTRETQTARNFRRIPGLL